MISVLQLAEVKRSQEKVVGNQVAFNTFHCSPLLNTKPLPPGHALRSHGPPSPNASPSPNTSPHVFPIFFRCVPPPAPDSSLSMHSHLTLPCIHPVHSPTLLAPLTSRALGHMSMPAATIVTCPTCLSISRTGTD